MNAQRIRWHVSQGSLGHLSAALRPIRSHREVGQMLGCSAALVERIEASALRKIVRAMTDWDEPVKPDQTNKH